MRCVTKSTAGYVDTGDECLMAITIRLLLNWRNRGGANIDDAADGIRHTHEAKSCAVD
jgi:hypothetical protein